MVYIVAASSLYHSLEHVSNPKKEQFLPKIILTISDFRSTPTPWTHRRTSQAYSAGHL